MNYFFTYIPVLEFSLAFGILLLVLCASLIYSKWAWWAKALLIISTPIIAVMAYMSITNSAGYAFRGKPLDKIYVIWIQIEHPSKYHLGAIRIWAKPLIENANYVEPRVFEIEYTEKRQKQGNDMINDIKKGKPVVLEFSEEEGESEGSEGEGIDGDSDSSSKEKGNSGERDNSISKGMPFKRISPELPKKN